MVFPTQIAALATINAETTGPKIGAMRRMVSELGMKWAIKRVRSPPHVDVSY